MKKIFVLFSFLSLSYFCFAQEHLTFKGIPIDGTLTEFVSKLEGEGYTLSFYNDEGYACMMNGSFAGITNCQIFIISSRYSHTVWKVAVYFPEQNSWYSLKSRYNEYKTSLIQKYGEPEEDYHFFTQPYYEGDGYELSALRGDKCTYIAFFSVPEGNMAIEMKSKQYNAGQVVISYEDILNTQVKIDEQQRSVNSDL